MIQLIYSVLFCSIYTENILPFIGKSGVYEKYPPKINIQQSLNCRCHCMYIRKEILIEMIDKNNSSTVMSKAEHSARILTNVGV
jgi:hypothetical protein